jgi:uncharacterized repeat protein (TIGR01451 family)
LKPNDYLVCTNNRSVNLNSINKEITMRKLTTLAAGIAVIPVLAFSGSALVAADSNPGQIEQGDIYRVKNANSSTFADNITAACGDTVQFRVRIHNGGPATLTNVKVAATLDQTSSTTSHGSQVSLSADNNLHDAVVTANAGVNTSAATTATYVSGSTELLNYSATPGGESVIKNLPDGILSGGVNIGSIGPVTSDTEEVQFSAKLNCATPPVTPPATPSTPATPATPAAPTALVNTGAGNVAAIFAAAVAFGAVAYRVVLSRRLSRQ